MAQSPELGLATGDEAAGYLQQPCLRRGRLCFVAEGDVWLAEAPAWRASRLTTLGTCCRPLLSPDADRVAFASSCHGAQEVFLLDLARRRPLERLTALGSSSTAPAAWAADGRRLYVTSPQPPLGYPSILQVPLAPSGAPAGPAAVCEFGRLDAEQLSFGPGDRLLIGRGTMDCHTELWKGYQGGRVGSCWIQEAEGKCLRRLDLQAEVVLPAPEDKAADGGAGAGAGAGRRRVPVHASGPAWLGERIYFVAELDGCGNLWSSSASGSDLRQHSFHRGFYARNPSSDGEGAVVYQRGGELWCYSTDSSKTEVIPVQLCAPQVMRLPEFHRASDNLEYCALHPDGHHVAASCRGRVFELALDEGPAVELRPPAAAGGRPAPFARCLAMCFTTAGSVLLVREGRSADPEAVCSLELHPPHPYMPQVAFKDDHFWALAEPEQAPPPTGLPDVWGLEPPRVAAMPKEVGVLRDIVASPVDELTVAATTSAQELRLLRLEAHGDPGPGRTLSLQDTTLVAHSPYGPDGISDMCWSHDGRWLAYTRQASQDSPGPTGIWVYDVKAAQGEAEPTCLTGQRFEESSPSFDPGGEYLAFISKRSLRPVPDEVMCSIGFCAGAQRPFVLLLTEASRNPLQRRPRAPGEPEDSGEDAPEGEEEGGANGEEEDPPELMIEAKGASGRVLEVPVQAGRYSRLVAIDGGLVYSREDPSKPPPTDEDDDASGSVFIYRFRKAKEQKVADGVRDFEVSLDGMNLMLELEDARVRVISIEHAGDPQNKEDDEGEDGCSDGDGGIEVRLDERVSLEVEPTEEWAQMFHETWRAVGTHFYDEAMGGVDWFATRAQYEPLLRRLGCRADLTDLLSEMCSELGASHMSVSGPPDPPCGEGSAAQCELGFLGADVAWDHSAGGYRVAKVVCGDVWRRDLGGPLARAGVAEGSVLLAVNRQRLGAGAPLEKLLANAAGCDVYLTIAKPGGAGPSGAGPEQLAPGDCPGKSGAKKKGKKGKKGEEKRAKQKAGAAPLAQTVRVRCVDHECDQLARYRDWVEHNCEKVHDASRGRIGYVHVPHCEGEGFAHFTRYYLSECSREALVLDVRGNDGGYISEMLLDRLTRTPLGVIVPRKGQGGLAAFPTHCLRNARTTVLLCDSWSCSDAEVLAASFRELGLGTVVGTQTWGGVLSVGDFDLELVDGGEVSIPSDNLFSLKEGCFALENGGVRPDLEVELAPDSEGLASDGLDLQLKEAVVEAERLLASHAANAAAVASRCRRLPRTREHLRWRVLSARDAEE